MPYDDDEPDLYEQLNAMVDAVDDDLVEAVVNDWLAVCNVHKISLFAFGPAVSVFCCQWARLLTEHYGQEVSDAYTTATFEALNDVLTRLHSIDKEGGEHEPG
jgi:hypothetical protein